MSDKKRIKFIFDQTQPTVKVPETPPMCPTCRQVTTLDRSNKLGSIGREYYACRTHGCEKPLFKWKRVG